MREPDPDLGSVNSFATQTTSDATTLGTFGLTLTPCPIFILTYGALAQTASTVCPF